MNNFFINKEMTTNKTPFWTNTILDITKPELSITFNSYDLVYDAYYMNKDNKPQSIPQGDQSTMQKYPYVESKVKTNRTPCGDEWTDASGNVYCEPGDSEKSDGACPYDKLQCPSDKIFLGKIQSGSEKGDCPRTGKKGNICCGDFCQSAQLVFCGDPKLKESIFLQNNE